MNPNKLFLCLVLFSCVITMRAQPTSFVYQGKLNENSGPANGAYDLRFSAHDSVTNGNLVSVLQTNAAVSVSAGSFTTQLDFGTNVFDGSARWLEIAVRTNGSAGVFSTLSPRQPINSTPYAIRAATATTATTAVVASTATIANAVSATNISGKIADGSLSTNVSLLNNNQTNTGTQSFSSAAVFTAAGAPFSVSSSNKVTNLNADLLDGADSSAFAPASGSTNYIRNQTSSDQSAGLRINGNGIFNGGGIAIGKTSVQATAALDVIGDTYLNGYDLYLRTSSNTNQNNGVGYYNATRLFAGFNVSGPVLYGANGALGTRQTGGLETIALYWNANHEVGIGTTNPTAPLTVVSDQGNALIAQFRNSSNAVSELDSAGNWSATSFTGAGTMLWEVVAGSTKQALPNHGYLLTNNNLVTVTLPASPNMGDIVRVSSTGTGGWKLAQNSGQYVLGNSIFSLGISSTWTPRATTDNWVSIASSADATILIAVTRNSPPDERGYIWTSRDSGVKWTVGPLLAKAASVALSADGLWLYAAGENEIGHAILYKSGDSGVNWSPIDPGASLNLAACSDDGKVVALTGSGTHAVFVSTNWGDNFNSYGTARDWSAITCSADGTKMAGTVTSGKIYTSTDSGQTWSGQDSARAWISIASSADGTKLIAAEYNGQIYTSTDSGNNWTARESIRNWRSVASSANGLQLSAVVENGKVFISNNSGVNWSARESARDWRSIAISDNGAKLVAVTYAGLIYTSEPLSVTTTGALGYLAGAQGTAVELQYIGNNQFMPISNAGTIIGF